MIPIFRIIYAVVVLIPLITYNFISSFIYFFVPRTLRKKKNITGQRILITGAGSGVGRALAIEFSKYATSLILVDINKKSLIETAKILDSSSSVFLYECDVTDYKKVNEMAIQVQKDAGDVDILVNNAGIVHGKFLWDLPEEKIKKTMEVNALAHFWTCKAFLPGMMKRNSGHIVALISVGGKCGAPKLTDYCSSKFAALGFAETLEYELRVNNLNGIRITTVCPSVIDTNLFKGADMKIGSSMSPEFVAKEVVAGVIENEEMIFLPRRFKFFLILKELVPRWIAIRLAEAGGSITVMDNFVGREPVENGVHAQDKAIKRE